MLGRYRAYDRSGAGLLDAIFGLAGDGRGVAGQVRLWSAILLALMGLLGLISGYFFLPFAVNPPLTAAQIESGHNPRLTYRRSRSRGTSRASYEITGRVSPIDAVTFVNQGSGWRCAPLVSQADSQPRVYYVATETSFRRSLAETRFAGDLYRATEHPYALSSATLPCDVPADGYLLVDDGSWRAWKETLRSLLITSAVIGSIALIAFVWSWRASSDTDGATPPTASRTDG